MYQIRNNKSFNNNHSNNKFFKNQLIDNIYNSIDLSCFKYSLLKSQIDLTQLLSTKFYVSANFTGTNCLLVFTTINKQYYSFLIDRKTLTYNKSKLDINNVKINNVKLKLNYEIYKGTIIDGTHIQTKNQNTFIITDVYTFKGDDFTKIDIKTKMSMLRSYLDNNYDSNDDDNTIMLGINKLYELNQIEQLVNKTIPNMKDFLIKSICFYPHVSGTKIIYPFDNSIQKNNNSYKSNIRVNSNSNSNSNDSITKSKFNNDYTEFNNNNTNSPNISSNKIYIPKKNKNDKDYVFEMKKTKIVDVYKLNIVEPALKNDKIQLKRVNIGIAYIPNIDKSNWCKNLFDDDDNSVLVSCKFHDDKNKWEPLRLSKSKKPSYVDDFLTLLA